jgi:glycosyltransferase involved in cell wall biosynthesis
MTEQPPSATRRGVLIIVQNSSVPFDRRVRLQSQALIEAGYRVSVICPKGPGDSRRQVLDGVHVYRYEPPPAASSLAEYMLKSAYCWLRSALLATLVVARDRVSIIQACSPPDTYWVLAFPFRLFGARFVYDQRDLNPELFGSRFGKPVRLPARILYRLLLWLEQRSYRAADHVIVAAESIRQVAIDRGQVATAKATVVRSGPDPARTRRRDAAVELRAGRKYLLAYHGSMGSQEGVDLVLRVLDVLVHRLGRQDVHAALLGFGDAYEDLVVLCHALDLDDHVTFTGRIGPDMIERYLSTADIGICPGPHNDVSTMNTTLEYLSFALPVIGFDLTEMRATGGDAVEYVQPGPGDDEPTVNRFAAAAVRLLDDPERRAVMAADGRRRAESILDWGPQRAAYVGVFDALSGREPGLPWPEPRQFIRVISKPGRWTAESVKRT